MCQDCVYCVFMICVLFFPFGFPLTQFQIQMQCFGNNLHLKLKKKSRPLSAECLAFVNYNSSSQGLKLPQLLYSLVFKYTVHIIFIKTLQLYVQYVLCARTHTCIYQ